jgi:hypothetical protein
MGKIGSVVTPVLVGSMLAVRKRRVHIITSINSYLMKTFSITVLCVRIKKLKRKGRLKKTISTVTSR